MAGWISSKLKVAETFLQQIDQQAAESLGKNEKPQTPSGSTSDELPKKIDSALPLKYQLPKKSPPPPTPPPDISRRSQQYNLESNVHPQQGNPAAAVRPSSANPDPAIIDWTELLSSPKPISPVASLNGRNKKNNKKPVIPAAPALDKKETQERRLSTSILSLPKGSEKVGEKKLSRNNEEEELPALSSSSSYGLSQGHSHSHPPSEIYHEKEDNDLHLLDEKAAADESCGGGDYRSAIESSDLLRDDDASGSSSGSDDRSNSGTEDSASASDSEDERQRREERRKRRERVIAEKVAAAAVNAIKEREDIVARLEGEKQSLEKILEEREKQAVQEASELQMSMIETMEAVELEKQKHNSTRMEALACLAKLETTNAELARSLATTQWNLEVEVNRVSELRQKIELKELAQEELRRRMSKIHQRSFSPSKEESLRKAELEQEILDVEYSFICNKIAELKDKAKKLEDNIENTRRERLHPTEVEVELSKRLAQLTDHLIQKQTQVEALSSEKATLVLRIEMVSRLLDENGLSLQTTDISNDLGKDLAAGSAAAMFDIEAGTWQQPSNSALRERIRSGQQQLGSLLHQLDAIFSAGAIFLRRNPMAQLWSLLYLLCLHIWVMYILMSSHSQVSDDSSSHGAVFSLEVINKTSGS